MMVGVIGKLGEGLGPAASTAVLSIPVYLSSTSFCAGHLACYQTGSPARLFSLSAQPGFTHFWRFVRITLVTARRRPCDGRPSRRIPALWSDDRRTSTANLAVRLSAGTCGPSSSLPWSQFFCASTLTSSRLYTVQRGLQAHPPIPGKKTKPERQIRRTFIPAWKTLSRNFFRVYLSVLVISLIGIGVVALAARTAMHSLAQPDVGLIFLLAQLGLFVMLMTRFWQRGARRFSH